MHIYEALHLYLSKEYKSCDLSRIQFPCDKKLLIIYVNIENHSILVAKSILQFYHITHRTFDVYYRAIYKRISIFIYGFV